MWRFKFPVPFHLPFTVALLTGAMFFPSQGVFGQAPCWSDIVAARNAHRLPVKTPEGGQTPLAGPVAGPRSVVTIPVVVHVVYKGNLENISEEQILSQMAVLNQDYRRLNANAITVPAFFAPLAADLELEFCLAQRDPGGGSTNGITRRQTAWDNIGQQIAPDGRPRINYTELGGEDAWDPAHYLNIWVGNIGGGILGFATFPGTAPVPEDGVVIDPRYFGTVGLAALYAPHHLGRTATHEIGHFFNLLHIWGGDGDSCDDDDEVADTPIQRSAFHGCPAYPQFSCGNSAMFMNFMDYTDDACMSLFTLGQKTRVWSTLTTTRSSLLESNYCTVLPVSEPQPNAGQLVVRPNPVRDVLMLDLDGLPTGRLQIRILTPGGQILLQQDYQWQYGDSPVLKVANLPAGYYLVLIIPQNGAAMARGWIKTR